MFNYPVELALDDNGTTLVFFPDIPEAITFGDDAEEALLRARDALETALMMYIDARLALPSPSLIENRPTVQLQALECAKLGLYQAMMEQGLRRVDLAYRLGWNMPQIDKLLDLKHTSRLDQIEAVARALNRQIEVQVSTIPTPV